MNKDLTVATGVFGACVLILIIAFSKPAEEDVPFEDPTNRLALADDVPTTDGSDDPPGFDDSFDPDDSIDSLGDTDSVFGNSATSMDTGLETADVGTDTAIAAMDGVSDIDEHLGDDVPDVLISDVGDADDSDIFVDDSLPGADVEISGSIDLSETDVAATSTSRPALGDMGSDRIHVVERGDILGTISQKYYGSTRYWRLIQDKNNVYANELQPGQRLIIPGIADAPAARVSTPAVASTNTIDLEPGQRSYTVKRGDNYYIIAQRELGDASRYRELERLNSIDAYELDVGNVIILPDAGTVRTTTRVEPRVLPGAKTHVVATGETLGDISKTYYGTVTRWRDIAAANGNVDPSRLKVGQKLQIPDLGMAAPAAATTSTASAATSTYTIKPSDTLGEISQRTLGTAKRWREIQAANPGLNPNKLPVGKKIVIPGGTSSTRSTSNTSSFDEELDLR